jgi:alanine-glyoxylate transaminase / serine-glyoxylate transaminase / serine-pyruvate transaminase
MSRIAGRTHLFVPGPTNVPDRVLRAMVVPQEDHRSPKFPELTLSVLSDLKKVFKTTEGTIVTFPASGTGMWEAALTNTLSPGDKVLVSAFGQFSFLWADMAKRLGFEVECVECEWGTGVPYDKYEEILRADKEHKIKAVLACQNETATGVSSDIAKVRKAMDNASHPALLMVDTVSSLVSIDFQMDAWGVDCAVSGSQKGFMLPAGMGILGLSPKAIKAIDSSRSPRCYFDLADMLKNNASGYFPYTPSIPMLHGMREALDTIFEEGLDEIFARHDYLANGVRAAVQEGWKLSLCAKEPQWYSNTVSAILVPEGFDAAKVISTAYKSYNLSLGAGLSKVAGKVFRIGHLGDLNCLSLMSAIAGAEMAMLDNGINVTPGSGVAAASTYWRTHAPKVK